jgi:membrane-associated phospholipid phosphatase
MGRRIATLWWFKMPGTIIGITGFFAAYFWVLHHPHFPVTIMPLTFVDHWIPFSGWALWLYLSLWFYVGLLPALLKNFTELVSYVWQVLALSVVGLGIFIFWPTVVATRDVERMQQAGFSILKGVDASGNACPSLHVAFAVFTAIGMGRVLREMGASPSWRGANWVWCAGICYSTIAIRQHVVIDVLAGAALGALIAFGRRKIQPRS